MNTDEELRDSFAVKMSLKMKAKMRRTFPDPVTRRRVMGIIMILMKMHTQVYNGRTEFIQAVAFLALITKDGLDELARSETGEVIYL